MAEDGGTELQREFKFTQRDFGHVQRLILELAGISLAPSKYEMVYHRLSRRLRVRGLRKFDEYLRSLETDPQELESFVNSLTTNLTAFFREADQFTILADYALARRNPAPLRIWCAASSTGEEAYSIALILAQAFHTLTPPVVITASDLDSEVLEIGKRAAYPMSAVERLPQPMLSRFFLKGVGKNVGRVRLRSEIRSLVTFQQLNLLDRVWHIDQRFDVIFCRNVLIYFNKDTQHRVLGNLSSVLSPDGLLFTGKSESLMHATGLFQSLGRCVYRRAPRSVASG